MKTLSLLFMSLVGSVLISLGVLKNDKPNTTPAHIQKMSLFIHKKWKMTDETTFTNGKTTNTFKDYKTCVSDDTFTFLPDGNLILDDNNLRCENAQSQTNQTTRGIWAFNIQDKNKLEIAVTMQFTAEIITVNDNTMVWKYQNQVGDVVTQTFAKQ